MKLGPSDKVPKQTGQYKGYSIIGNATYNFYQLHWHTPSENTIDGEHFAMEAHFVHQLNDSNLVGTTRHVGVISVMYSMSSTCNKELDLFWSQMPVSSGLASFELPIDFQAMLDPLLSAGYYSWMGSLTTPPCTEGVSWNLVKLPSTVCERQVRRLRRALATTQEGVDVNNRVVQQLNGRVVFSTPGPKSRHDGAAALASAFVALAIGGIVVLLIAMRRCYAMRKRAPKAWREMQDYSAGSAKSGVTSSTACTPSSTPSSNSSADGLIKSACIM